MTNFVKRYSQWILVFAALASLYCWFILTSPRLAILGQQINRHEAITLAKQYLNQHSLPINDTWQQAVVFNVDVEADRFLQRALGQELPAIIQQFDIKLFYWTVRFFKPKQKDEYVFYIDAHQGKIIGFYHVLDESAAALTLSLEESQKIAQNFLEQQGYKLNYYQLKDTKTNVFDHRTEYDFQWQHQDFAIGWKDIPQQQTKAKLVTNVVVSGGKILSFHHHAIDVPETFSRYVQEKQQDGQILLIIFKCSYLLLIVGAILTIIKHHQWVVLRLFKRRYVMIATLLWILLISNFFNEIHLYLISFNTSQDLWPFLIQVLTQVIIGSLFFVASVTLTGMAGETWRFINTAQLQLDAGVNIFKSIQYGYIGFCLLLAAQAVIFNVGYEYLGVWQEMSYLTPSSTAYIPALSAMMIAISASLSEELMFRLFGVAISRHYIKNTALAILIINVMWGLGHSGYAVFPMWFRAIEVTLLGLMLTWLYLRFGIITALVAHYLLDAFLISLPFLASLSLSMDSVNAMGILLLPLFVGYFIKLRMKRPVALNLDHWLSATHQFQIKLLTVFFAQLSANDKAYWREQLVHEGWDPFVVDKAIKNTHF